MYLCELLGHGLAKFIQHNNENLTAVDVSANSMGTAGMMPVIVALEECYGMLPKLALKVRIVPVPSNNVFN